MSTWYSSSGKPIDKLLQARPILDQLLNQPDFLSQLKAFNSRLLEYITNNPDTLIKACIDFMLVPPTVNDTPQRKFKYPLLACEMIETEALCVANGFFKECFVNMKSSVIEVAGNQSAPNLMLDYFFTQMFEQLKKGSLLNICAGYFFRVSNTLMIMKFRQMVEHVYNYHSEYIKRLLPFTYNPSISNTLQLLLSLDATKADKLNIHMGEPSNPRRTMEFRKQIVRAIVNKLAYEKANVFDKTGDSASTIQNLCNILIEIVQKYYLISDGKEMLDAVVDNSSLEVLFDLSLSPVSEFSVPPMTLLISIINYYSFSSLNNEEPQENLLNSKASVGSKKSTKTSTIQKMEEQPLIKVLAKNFQRFTSFLANSPQMGLQQHKVLQVLCHSVSLSSNQLLSAIKKTGFLELLIELLFKHQNSNISHTLIERTFLHIFVNEKQFYEEHKFYIFCQMNIIGRTAGRVANEGFNALKKKGYFGHLMRIIKIYSSIQTTNENIIESIRENSELWSKITNEVIKPYEEITFKELGTFQFPNPAPLEFKVRQNVPVPKPKAQLIANLDDEYNEFKKDDDPYKYQNQQLVHVSQMVQSLERMRMSGNSPFNSPAKHLFTSNQNSSQNNNNNSSISSNSSINQTQSIHPVTREFIASNNTRISFGKNESFEEFIEKKKIQAEEQIKLKRSQSQEKRVGSSHSVGMRSPSPKRNSWVEQEPKGRSIQKRASLQPEGTLVNSPQIRPQAQHPSQIPHPASNKKAIPTGSSVSSSASGLVIPQVKIKILDYVPTKKYKLIDQNDMILLNFLGIPYAR